MGYLGDLILRSDKAKSTVIAQLWGAFLTKYGLKRRSINGLTYFLNVTKLALVKIASTLVAILFTISLSAQILSLQDQLEIELDKYGLDYLEVQEALFIRGYDIENMTEVSPGQAEDIRSIIQFLIDQKAKEVRRQIDTIAVDTVSIEDPDDELLEEEDFSEEEIIEPGKEIFGHHLFTIGQFKLTEPSEDLIAPVDYLLGVGDMVVISIFGRNAQFEQEYRIGDDGTIRVNDNKNRVYLSGLNLNQATRKITAVFQGFMMFRSDEISLMVKGSKTVKVEIFGEVNAPGSYIISSFNSIYSAIVAAEGPNENASLRNIRLISANGNVQIFDLYDWITNPGNYDVSYLENGDIIHVPVSTSRIKIAGEVRRPMYYDLIKDDGIMDIIEYSGGLKPNAYLKNFRVIRQDGVSRNAIDISYLELLRTGKNFILNDGDEITVSAISEELENYVRVTGEVRNEGDYEWRSGMKVLDLLRKSTLKESSRTDIAYLLRRGNNEKIEIEAINLDKILADPNSPENILLQNKDELLIYKQSRYTDEEFVIISGAVRFPDTLNHDASERLRIRDYINMAGGLKKKAASFAHVHRINPLNPSEIEYRRVDLERAFNDDNAVDNIVLLPFDSVYIYFEEDFEEERTIKVSGAVNAPGDFAYGINMTLADAIILAGGFKLSSSTNEIEISRVIIKDNQPTAIILEKVRVDRDITTLSKSKDDIFLRPFDNIFIREVPEFELQQNVLIEGEVRLPGEYSLIKSNETVYDLLMRAGGVTAEGFPAGAQLFRREDSLGYVVMRLDEVINNAGSKYNYNLKDGDVITIPKKKDYVTIRGATRAIDAVDKNILGPNNEINVPYHPGKSAKFYIDYYAGGFAPRADKKKIFVRHPNGEVRQVEKKIFVVPRYPEVRQGSVISVGYKEAETLGSREEKDVDWTKVLGDSVGQAMSILTLILLVQRLD